MIATRRARRLTEDICREAAEARRIFHRTRNAGPLLQTGDNIREAFASGQISLDDISLTALWDMTVRDGKAVREAMMSMPAVDVQQIFEAEAVKTTDFDYMLQRMISGQLLREYDSADFIQDMLAEVTNSRFRSERIPGMGDLGDGAEVVGEGQPYPIVGIGSDYVDTPRTEKRGFIVPVAREAVFFDQTGALLTKIRRTAEAMMLNKEKRVIRTAVGYDNTWNYNGTNYNTYQNGGGGELFDNTAGSNPFTSWSSLTAAEQLMSVLKNPLTNEYINVGRLRTILVGTITLRDAVTRVVGASEIREVTSNTTTISRNPKTGYTVLYSPYVADYATATDWFLGDFKRAMRYRQNWGIETDTAGAGSDDAFNSDIVSKFKVSEMASSEVDDPRYACKNTAS